MAIYNYRAVDGESKIISGRMEASGEGELEDRLGSKGLRLIEAAKGAFWFKTRARLKKKDLLNFTYFMNLILTSGISLMDGLGDMARQSANKRLSQAASLIYDKIESGKSISESMLEYPELFPQFYTSMIRAGEVSGNLEQVFNDLMAYIEWQMKLRKDIRNALAYPLVVLTALASLILILFVFVMPKFIKILTDLKVTLPLPTKILIGVVNFITGYWIFILLFFVSLPFIYRIAYKSEKGRRFIDGAVLGIPLFGELVRKLNHSRYFRTFATLYRSGLNMNETLRVSAEVIGNSIIAESFRNVSNSVLGGEQLNKALRDSGGFAHLLVNMVEIGEKTGTLDSTILRISDMYDRDIPETLKRIFMILEPVSIALLGGLVLLTVASFFLPLYKIVGGIAR